MNSNLALSKEFVDSPCVCMGFLQVLWFPPALQNHSEAEEIGARMSGWSVPWSMLLSLSLWSLQLSVSQTIPKVFDIYPRVGSRNGATRLTIKGKGFSGESQFDYGAENEKLGNSVQLVSETRSIPCDVEKDSSHETQIVCYTRPLPIDRYLVVVSVDGVPTYNKWMTYYARNYNTPTIEEISPKSGFPGLSYTLFLNRSQPDSQLITIRGKIVTDFYSSNEPEDSNHRNTRILRVYAGGMLCDLLHPDSDTLSLPDVKVYFVSSLNKLSMFQTYAVYAKMLVKLSKSCSFLYVEKIKIHSHCFRPELFIKKVEREGSVTRNGQALYYVSSFSKAAGGQIRFKYVVRVHTAHDITYNPEILFFLQGNPRVQRRVQSTVSNGNNVWNVSGIEYEPTPTPSPRDTCDSLLGQDQSQSCEIADTCCTTVLKKSHSGTQQIMQHLKQLTFQVQAPWTSLIFHPLPGHTIFNLLVSIKDRLLPGSSSSTPADFLFNLSTAILVSILQSLQFNQTNGHGIYWTSCRIQGYKREFGKKLRYGREPGAEGGRNSVREGRASDGDGTLDLDLLSEYIQDIMYNSEILFPTGSRVAETLEVTTLFLGPGTIDACWKQVGTLSCQCEILKISVHSLGFCLGKTLNDFGIHLIHSCFDKVHNGPGSLYAYGCVARYDNNAIYKFVDDITYRKIYGSLSVPAYKEILIYKDFGHCSVKECFINPGYSYQYISISLLNEDWFPRCSNIRKVCGEQTFPSKTQIRAEANWKLKLGTDLISLLCRSPQALECFWKFCYQFHDLEVTGIYPSEGSVEGGTRLTVKGKLFDETDTLARVTVADLNCEILSVNSTEIICQAPREGNLSWTVFPGGRGLKVETWKGGSLSDLPNYSESTVGYTSSWTDEAYYKPSTPWTPSVTRLSGFFIAPETDNFRFSIKGRGAFELYFSLTGLPQDKVYLRHLIMADCLLIHLAMNLYENLAPDHRYWRRVNPDTEATVPAEGSIKTLIPLSQGRVVSLDTEPTVSREGQVDWTLSPLSQGEGHDSPVTEPTDPKEDQVSPDSEPTVLNEGHETEAREWGGKLFQEKGQVSLDTEATVPGEWSAWLSSRRYYTEVVLQEDTVNSFVSVGVYRDSSSYTEQQTADSVNEEQFIKSYSQVVYEKQIVTLENWTKGSAVSEVQQITITSPCWVSGSCSHHWYRLTYNHEHTGFLPADASDKQIKQALSDLWSIRPDEVKVSSTGISQGFVHTVTFISTRGDFDLLQHEVLGGSNITIEVVEQVKGRPSMDTFTLRLDGINSRPLLHSATVDEVKAALDELVGVKCPEHIAGYTSGYAVKYFNDFEDQDSSYHSGLVTMETDAFCGRYSVKNPYHLFGYAQSHQPVLLNVYRQLCFAYKGILRNNILLLLSYNDEGKTVNTFLWLLYSFTQENQWSYTCINLLNNVRARISKGSNFLLKSIILLRKSSAQDYFVDTVYIGQHATTSNQEDVPERAVPPLFKRGIIIKKFTVTQKGTLNDSKYIEYEITMIPFNCSFNIPLLEIGFAQPESNSTKEESIYRGITWPSGSSIRVRRTEAASPPITGTLDIKVFGRLLKGLPATASNLEMQYSLRTIPDLESVSVRRTGVCSGYIWRVKWMNKPGNQPILQVNDSNVRGIHAGVMVFKMKQGGLFSQRMIGDLFRTPHAMPQVHVYINGIPSKCSGNCGYRWNLAKSPVITGISPSRGSSVSGTVLTVSGFQFANSSKTDTTWVSVGGANCPIMELTDTEITCLIGPANTTVSPLTVYIAELGFAKHSVNPAFTFTYQLEVTSVSPSEGSTEGGSTLRISGSGFTPRSAVLIGEKACPILTQSPAQITCTSPPAPVGVANISVFTDEAHITLPSVFTYTEVKMPTILQITPTASSVAGGSRLTIYGSDFGSWSENTSVFVGNSECPILQWWANNVTCQLPSLAPGHYPIWMHTPDSGVVNISIEYVLRVTGMAPRLGSLYGGTTITISGAGFSPIPVDNAVHLGPFRCPVIFASPNVLECVLDPTGRSFYVSNNGSNPVLGVGYSWNPSTLDILVGDIVHWQWETPSLIQGLGYRVFSVSKPSDVNYKGNGFTSGATGTLIGAFSHRFTTPQSKYIPTNNSVDWQPHLLLANMDTLRLHAWALCTPKAKFGSNKIYKYINTPCHWLNNRSDESELRMENLIGGAFSHRFTTPGSFFYSSGLIDQKGKIFLQGAVHVRVPGERSLKLAVSVNGIEAEYKPGPLESVLSDREHGDNCTAMSPTCTQAVNSTSDSRGFTFVLSPCYSPTINRITPSNGTLYDRLTIAGTGFSNVTCAHEVRVGNHTCIVEHSTERELVCHMDVGEEMEVGMANLVTVKVHNHGNALPTPSDEFARRFVLLPHIDRVSPSVGSTTGWTRVTLAGSGFGKDPKAIRVLLAAVPCALISVNYTHISCNSSASMASSGSTSVWVRGVLAVCRGPCDFTYTESVTPTVLLIFPSILHKVFTEIRVSGRGFGSRAEMASVLVGTTSFQPSDVSDTSLNCTVGPLPVGRHPLRVLILDQGISKETLWLTTAASASLSPASGGINGGTTLSITGNGFVQGMTTVTIGDTPCPILSVTPGEIQCVSPACGPGVVHVKVAVQRTKYPLLSFSCNQKETPTILDVSPTAGMSGTSLTIVGRSLGSTISDVSVSIDGILCNVTLAKGSTVECAVGQHAGGRFPIVLKHRRRGYAASAFSFQYLLNVTSIFPTEGTFGGGLVLTVQGTGFDRETSRVLVCDGDCRIERGDSSSSRLCCHLPLNNGTGSQQVCDVTVVNHEASSQLPKAFTYTLALTPVVTAIRPRRGGTAGGTKLTITGAGFSINKTFVSVAEAPCEIQYVNETNIVCVTGVQTPSQKTKVKVNVQGNGIAKLDFADYYYVDVWSSRYTWGGLSPPERGSLVVITKGQTILLDQSTPVLKMLLIQGGALVFDEVDIELQAENILITEGGLLQVGTNSTPFRHKAIITLHGHLRSKELPLYGSKTLAVREGTLDLHGLPIPVTWTHLAETAEAGSSTITLQRAVSWKPGDQIVIASTGGRHSQRENEERTVEAVSLDERTLSLTEPLRYRHLGTVLPLPGAVLEARAEVGLLTRNVVVRGSENTDWEDRVERCPEGFNIGQFATQTCFQGRLGEEIGSDEYGGCIMFHSPQPGIGQVVGRLQYVEIYHAGQAFRLGRYPLHWHLLGDLSFQSYVRGCSIHRTFNRAVTIHGTHQLLVEGTVAFNIKGGAFFLEDGVEQGNVLQHNLALLVRQSTNLLNDDLTPAAFWVTNPANILRHNSVAGGSHFGFWYRLLERPTGASLTQTMCPRKVPLGLFQNNTAHSLGWYGLWIFPVYHPSRGGWCWTWEAEPAAFHSLTAWNCLKGAEWADGGALQFHHFLLVNNQRAGAEAQRLSRPHLDGWGLAGGALLTNLTVVGHVEGLGLGPSHCTQSGLVLPLDDGLTVEDVRFINFDRPGCSALGLMSSIPGLCTDGCGGWGVRFSQVRYFNTSNKASFQREHQAVLYDVDGSLTGGAGYKVVPHSQMFDPTRCHPSAEWSQDYPGVVCDSSVTFHRLAVHNPSPSALLGCQLILSNTHGTSVLSFLLQDLSHEAGWMALIHNNQTVNWYFKDVDHITEISYTATFYHFMEDDNIVVSHNLTQRPDHIQFMDLTHNASLQPLNWTYNRNGDWYFDTDNMTLYYLVSGRGAPHQPSLDPAMVDISIHLRIFRCFYQDCGSPQATMLSYISSVSKYSMWSNSSFWKSSPENNFTVPAEGDSVVVAQGVWLLVDTLIPSLYKLTIYGVLEIKDENTTSDHSSSSYMSVVLNATYISIQGGRFIAGTLENPFRGELLIVLRGDHSTPDWTLPYGPNQGAKVLGVFGGLDLHGRPHQLYRTKLGATALAASGNITLAAAVDWQEGDQILLTSTSSDPKQSEIRIINSVSPDRRSLLLDQPLSFTHLVEKQEGKRRTWRYSLAADVGLLSRNIKITGEDSPNRQEELFGARVLISSFVHSDQEISGYARIKDVEFFRSGQMGYLDYFDPRYSVAFLNVGQMEGNESYVQGCAIHNGFAPAIGIFGTDGLNIDDNIIYNTLGEGIKVWGSRSRVRRNLVVLSKSAEIPNSWTAAIEVNKGSDIVLQENIIAGFDQIGYHINGEPCPGQPNPVEAWTDNEVRGGRIGVYMNGDGLPNCSLIQGFTVWKCQDYGIYFQTECSVQISNVTLVENGLGIFPMINGPPALSHRISNKTIHITNSLVVGVSVGSNCSESLHDNPASNGARSWSPQQPWGRSGISWPTFASATNSAPRHSFSMLLSYPAISGKMLVQNTTFVGFQGVCSQQLNVMFISNPENEDMQHPILVKGITVDQSEEPGKVFIHRPDLSKVNPSDCVDMDCDGKKKTLLKDLDGSFLGRVGAVIPQSEYQWNGDKRHGLGDYRIPKVLLTSLNGSRLPVSQVAPHKGIIRDHTCTYVPAWQSYKCFGLNYEVLVIESLDSDTEHRRLSPVALLCDGYLDLINGPQDHGWCSGYMCQKRISLFYAIVATSKACDVYFTSTNPYRLRLLLLNADVNRAVRLSIYYSMPQRLDVYINDTLIPPTNAEWNSEHTDYTLKAPTYTGEFVPKLNSSLTEANYFDRKNQMLHVIVQGSIPVEVHTAPTLFITFNLPAMTVDEFYGPDLANNLALFLNVPTSKIRITKIMQESGHRKRRATGITVDVEIGDPPSQQLGSNRSNSTNTTTSAETLRFTDLKKMAGKLGEAMLTGNLSDSLGFTISSLDISSPVPAPSDPEWTQMASEPVLRGATARNRVAPVAGLVVVIEPIAGDPGQELRQQPSVMAVDAQGNCVSVRVTSWKLDVVLVDSWNRIIAGLNGTTKLSFTDCWANFTDLSISANGTGFRLRFQLRSMEARSRLFSPTSAFNAPGGATTLSSGTMSDSGSQLSPTHSIIVGSVVGVLLLLGIAAAMIWKTAAPQSKVTPVTGRVDKQRAGTSSVASTLPVQS
ncbi:PKHD1 like 1, tandem duplicate 1 [Narcine bancroftii]|uniref:PKHD1 like 1, tandem duplicate 1 n=1 Tax=Narcine bancroftii TaxID=1343680 RepID=UPI003831AEAF